MEYLPETSLVNGRVSMSLSPENLVPPKSKNKRQKTILLSILHNDLSIASLSYRRLMGASY